MPLSHQTRNLRAKGHEAPKQTRRNDLISDLVNLLEIQYRYPQLTPTKTKKQLATCTLAAEITQQLKCNLFDVVLR